ncbi:MAG TPA: endonuclease III [Methanomicrobiales archaeon]|nr:endonuclease III [Methanomicrobiales archaeon]
MDTRIALHIYRALARRYPEAYRRDYGTRSPFRVLITTILSAQTTDRQVDGIAPALFSRFPTPEALAVASQGEVEDIVHPTGFFHTKARHIIAASGVLVRDFGGKVPGTMEGLLTLPGVGRKTANIVLAHGFGIHEGIAVDTHVRRIARRIGLSDASDPDRIEHDLAALYPKKLWGAINSLFITHGRTLCTARNPHCPVCPVRQDCRYFRNLKQA